MPFLTQTRFVYSSLILSLTSLTFSHFQPTLGRLSLTLILHSHSPYPLPPSLSHTHNLPSDYFSPPQLHILDWLPTLHFPHGGPLICRLFSSSMWEVLFSTTSHIPSKINSFENLLSICSRRFSNQYRIASNP